MSQPSTNPVTRHTQVGDYRDVVRIVASHCCLCRRELTDASSVQNGIGPICSSKYYSDAHVPSPDEILHATGSLAASGLPDEIIDAVLAQIDKTNGREACNILVYFASANYEDRDTIFKVASIVRDFGYTELADKLEEDRTKVSIRTGDDNGTEIIVVGVSQDKWQARNDFLKVKGSRKLSKEGRKYRYAFPADAKTKLLVECILGYHYGSKLATVGDGFLGKTRTGITHVPRRSWSDLEAFRSPKTAGTTKVATTSSGQGGAVRIVDPGGNSRIEFWSPYNGAWLADMKAKVNYRNRRWNNSCWTFERSVLDIVKALAQTHYGVTL
tara:strand:+ start:1947 stop:2927 length:981 start_codon:yes stop_codon:yes gene_type:complete